jgi:hypothetical protein
MSTPIREFLCRMPISAAAFVANQPMEEQKKAKAGCLDFEKGIVAEVDIGELQFLRTAPAFLAQINDVIILLFRHKEALGIRDVRFELDQSVSTHKGIFRIVWNHNFG